MKMIGTSRKGGHIPIGKPHHFIGKLILGIWALYQPTSRNTVTKHLFGRPSHIAPRTTNDPWWSALNITHRWSWTWQGWTCRMHWTGGICSFKNKKKGWGIFFSFFLNFCGKKVVMFLNNICLNKIRIWEVFCSMVFRNMGCFFYLFAISFWGQEA